MSSVLSAEEDLLILISNTVLTFLANALLVLTCSNLLYLFYLKWIFTFFFNSHASFHQRVFPTRDFVLILQCTMGTFIVSLRISFIQ